MLSDSRIEALLVVPMLHDFANGDYQVESYDKHVIRLAYNGATYKPKNLMYDVAVTVYN
jgi:high-affinity nickel permease